MCSCNDSSTLHILKSTSEMKIVCWICYYVVWALKRKQENGNNNLQHWLVHVLFEFVICNLHVDEVKYCTIGMGIGDCWYNRQNILIFYIKDMSINCV